MTTDRVTRHWIAGIDGSPDGCAALNWAVDLAGRRGETVTPLTAWHLPLAIRLAASKRPLEVDRLGLQAEAEVLAAETTAAMNAPAGLISEPRVEEGHPGPVLLAASGADRCVVVGRRGISDLKHRLLGSVSQYLATHANGPIVVVPAEWPGRPCRKIVVGFDGSTHAQAALRWALDIAPDDATVTALIAIELIPWLQPDVVEQQYPTEVEMTRSNVLAAAATVDPDGEAERTVAIRAARQALTDAWADADLVVVGPRGLGGVARAVLGSVTTWLLHEAPCPVAVVPHR